MKNEEKTLKKQTRWNCVTRSDATEKSGFHNGWKATHLYQHPNPQSFIFLTLYVWNYNSTGQNENGGEIMA